MIPDKNCSFGELYADWFCPDNICWFYHPFACNIDSCNVLSPRRSMYRSSLIFNVSNVFLMYLSEWTNFHESIILIILKFICFFFFIRNFIRKLIIFAFPSYIKKKIREFIYYILVLQLNVLSCTYSYSLAIGFLFIVTSYLINIEFHRNSKSKYSPQKYP